MLEIAKVCRDQLYQAIEHLRLDPQMRQRAQEIQALMADWPGAINTATFLAERYSSEKN